MSDKKSAMCIIDKKSKKVVCKTNDGLSEMSFDDLPDFSKCKRSGKRYNCPDGNIYEMR